MRPFVVYASTDTEGIWERISDYNTLRGANRFITNMTLTPIEKRTRRFTIIPDMGNATTIVVRPEQVREIYDNAK